MKAAVCYEAGKPLRIEEVEIDAPHAGEVKVRIAACAICHSDVHLIRGEWGETFPIVAGHEAAGIVEEVGEGVTLTRPGDHVVVSLLRACGRCYYCTRGLSHHCEYPFALRTESRLRTQSGEPIIQGLATGAFAEYVVVDQSQVVQIPREMPLDRAALLACGVITGVGAVINTAQVKPGSTVAVIGTGGVGLNALQGARRAGAARIIAIDLLEEKLAAARSFGATHTLLASREDLQQAVRELTDGRGVDYAFVTVGSAAAIMQALTLLRRAGMLLIVGIPPREAMLTLPASALVFAGATIQGCTMGSTRLSRDIPWLVDLYQQGRLKLGELISAHYPLGEINEAIAGMERGAALRNMLVME